MSALRSGMAI